jgi:ABC-type transporter Mla maintaining outer membrane lipid asymmetry permease subunit MlaE
VIEFFGEVSLFRLRVIVDFFRPPFEGVQLVRQIAEAGSKSLPLVIASGLSIGTVEISEVGQAK